MSIVSAPPQIGDRAPDFTAATTQGPLTFSAWHGGSWVMLFSHPADLTPVCASELEEFARRDEEFRAVGVKLIGLSADTLDTHRTWIGEAKSRASVAVNYPLVADPELKVAKQYGMIHPNASETWAVRGVFIIDPAQTIRAIAYYPINIGRNVDELLRLTRALQRVDEDGCSLRVNWRPGDAVVPPWRPEAAEAKA